MQKLNNNIRLKSQLVLQLCRTWMILWTSIGLGKLLKRISKL